MTATQYPTQPPADVETEDARFDRVVTNTVVRHAALDLAHTFLCLAERLIRNAEDREVYYSCADEREWRDMSDAVRLAERAIGRGKVANADYAVRVHASHWGEPVEWREIVDTYDMHSNLLHHEAHAFHDDLHDGDGSSPIERGIRRYFHGMAE